MKAGIFSIKRTGLLLVAFMLVNIMLYGATFTAATNGSWSVSTTWVGGVAPSFTTSDQIVIPSGITVTLDNNVAVSGVLSSLTINGMLSSTSNMSLTIVALGTV